MITRFARRPIAFTLAALAVAAFGSASAASEPSPAVPDAPGLPDVNAIVAQAREMAKQFRKDEAVWLALDDEFAGLPPSMAFFANDFSHPREIIKNAPYTADAVTESIQILGDGNRIVRKSTTLLARDGAGRTRQERKGDGRSGVYIYDPMEGRSVVLNENTRTATRIPRVPGMPSPPEPPMPPIPPVPPLPPLPPAAPGAGAGAGAGAGSRQIEVQPGRVTVRRRDAAGDDGRDREDVRVEVIRIGRGEHTGEGPPMPPLPPLMLPMVPRGKGETKSLGSREFDGIKADGTMTSHTIPAGEIGNDKPIVVTSERWFSPELHLVVFAKTTDPRAGETIYRLANVKKGEPSAELFRIPSDYTTRGEGRKTS
ncbi:MAG: hypothetical protein ABI624_14595 [Casimicrobiaceae bacterium]